MNNKKEGSYIDVKPSAMFRVQNSNWQNEGGEGSSGSSNKTLATEGVGVNRPNKKAKLKPTGLRTRKKDLKRGDSVLSESVKIFLIRCLEAEISYF